METFKKLDKPILLTYATYLKAYQWDRYKLCFPCGLEPIESITEDENYGLYLNHNLIGYGTIMVIEEEKLRYIPNEKWLKNSIHLECGVHKAELSLIIHPKYQHNGYGKKLLNYMIEEANKNYDSVIAVIYKNNKKSLSLVEKSDFDFLSFSEDQIIFEKKLDKKDVPKIKSYH